MVCHDNYGSYSPFSNEAGITNPFPGNLLCGEFLFPDKTHNIILTFAHIVADFFHALKGPSWAAVLVTIFVAPRSPFRPKIDS